jgi:hypothetical protein
MSYFQFAWLAGRGFEQMQAASRHALSKPFTGNPPALLKPTRCRVTRPFCVGGQRVEPEAIVVLEAFTARSLAAIGRVEIED